MPDAQTIVQGLAVVIGLLAAYGAKADGFRAFLGKLTPKKAQERSEAAEMDAAWRKLVDDSRRRKCLRSVELCNEWQAIRNECGLETTQPTG